MVRRVLCGATMAVLLPAAAAHAQMRWQDRGFVNANIGIQAGGDDVTLNVSREVYDEQMTIRSSHDIGSGALWDFSAGYRVWRNLAAGIGFSAFGNDKNAVAEVSIPHPLNTDEPRTGTTEASGLEHSQRQLHFIASWMIPVTDKIDVALSVGPSIFFVKQDIITDVAFSEIGEPYTSVTIGGPVVSEVKETGVGFNLGADVTYLLRPRWGVGAFMRYSGGSVSVDEVEGGDIGAGGFQLGFGARYRF